MRAPGHTAHDEQPDGAATVAAGDVEANTSAAVGAGTGAGGAAQVPDVQVALEDVSADKAAEDATIEVESRVAPEPSLRTPPKTPPPPQKLQ